MPTSGMSPMVYFVLLTVIFLCMPFCNANRVLSSTINPGCDFCGEDVNVLYVKSVGSYDVMHYLWSTNGTVSALLARTAADVNLTISWDKFLSSDPSNSVRFAEEPYEVSVVILTSLYEYEDEKDKVDIEKIPFDDIHNYNTTDMVHLPVSLEVDTNDHVSALFLMQLNNTNNTMQLTFDVYSGEGHADRLPRLDHTSQSFQMEIVLNGFQSDYNDTRFAVEFIMLNLNKSEDVFFQVIKHKTIDDEYTPGVFLTYSIEDNNGHINSSFMQWKPICYTKTDRTPEYSTNSIHSINHNLTVSDREYEMYSSLGYAYFGDDVNRISAGWLNVSFGLEGDGFYQDSDYLSWTVVIGIGESASEKFSTLVIVVIVVGFGVPALLILIGGVVILVRRFRRNDDDLNLSNAKLFEEEEE
ncbi:hypothetical protein CHUAL_001436 [Chamberlinius hualienensis]